MWLKPQAGGDFGFKFPATLLSRMRPASINLGITDGTVFRAILGQHRDQRSRF
jgi:hypothetical protein